MPDPSRLRPEADADPRIEATLRYVIAIGVVLVLLLPGARGMHATIGWLPLWLVAMPMTACWALRRFARPVAGRAERPAGARVRARMLAQARRRAPARRCEGLPRAA